MNNTISISLCFLTIIVNGLIGHFFAPKGIDFTPFVLIITSSLIAFGTKSLNVFLLSLLTYLFVALNDISIKLYSGGTHDNEGLAWIHFFLFIGLVPAFGILLTAIFRQKDEKITRKILATILFIILVGLHLKLFSDLGLGRNYWYEWNN